MGFSASTGPGPRKCCHLCASVMGISDDDADGELGGSLLLLRALCTLLLCNFALTFSSIPAGGLVAALWNPGCIGKFCTGSVQTGLE